MRLSVGQRETIAALSKILPLDVLLRIKEGKIKDFGDLHLNLLDPNTPEERTEMDKILEKEIEERKRKLNRVLQIKC